MSTEIITALIASLTTLGTIVITPVISSKFTKKQEDPLKESLEMNDLIIDKLENIKKSYGADRVWLIQFHNGGYFYPTGKSIQKFSMVYEQLSEKSDSVQGKLQNIPVSLFNKTINKLHDGYHVITDKISNPVEKYGITTLLVSSIEESYMFPVITITDTFIGIVGIDFSEEVKLNKIELSKLDVEIATISGVLMNYLNMKKINYVRKFL